MTTTMVWWSAFTALCLLPPLILYVLSTILIRRTRSAIRSIRLHSMLSNMPEDCWIIIGYRDEYGLLNTPDLKIEDIPQQRLIVIHGVVFREQYQ